MNLYLRLLKVLLRIWLGPKKGLMDASRLAFRVWPHDCDLNLHMNNGRYLTLMDLGRIHLIGQMKLLPQFVKNRWHPILGAAEISFIRPLSPFRRFFLLTRILTWDEKYFYIEHQFVNAQGRLCAVALIRGLFMVNAEKITPQQAMTLLGPIPPAPPMPESVRQWNALLALKRP